ncbi:Calcium-activated chloride channel regulator 1 [Nymphon striatum]|nr:Calcium-activated chloride channel regulator 1 [Nymphon striatum]
MIHQWAHLRFGVFDEFGYVGDELYPPFYLNETAESVPTGCSNIPVVGDIFKTGTDDTCGETIEEEHCSFIPSETENENVKSSLMYLANLPNVSSFCGHKQFHHIVEAPTKHNFLCDYKSIWNILESSDDYKNLNASVKNLPPRIYIELVNPPEKLKFAMAVDTSCVSADRKHLSAISMAVSSVLFQNSGDFDSDKTVLITFDKRVNVNRKLQNIHNNSVKSDLVKLAVQTAIGNMTSKKINSLILITNGIVNETDMNDIEKAFGGKHLRLFVIIYPATKDLNKRWFALASKLFIINGGSKLETLGELIPALNEIHNIIGTNEKYYIKRYFNDCELKVPEHLSKILFFGDTSSPNSLTIYYSNHTYSTRKTLTYDSSKLDYPYLEYKFEKLGQKLSINSNNTLMIFCYDKNENINFTGWSDNDQRLLGEPMTIFAALTVNYQPIINVKTRAVLHEYWSRHKRYSGKQNYFHNFKIGYVPQQNASIASNRTWLDKNCCGRYVDIPKKDKKTVLLPEIDLLLGSFLIVKQVSRKIPPSRIIDLKLLPYSSAERLSLTWTPIKSEHTMKISYQIGFSDSRADAAQGNVTWITSNKTSKNSSSKLIQRVNIPSRFEDSSVVYCVVQATNEEGNSSKPSNVVYVTRELFSKFSTTLSLSSSTVSSLEPKMSASTNETDMSTPTIVQIVSTKHQTDYSKSTINPVSITSELQTSTDSPPRTSTVTQTKNYSTQNPTDYSKTSNPVSSTSELQTSTDIPPRTSTVTQTKNYSTQNPTDYSKTSNPASRTSTVTQTKNYSTQNPPDYSKSSNPVSSTSELQTSTNIPPRTSTVTQTKNYSTQNPTDYSKSSNPVSSTSELQTSTNIPSRTSTVTQTTNYSTQYQTNYSKSTSVKPEKVNTTVKINVISSKLPKTSQPIWKSSKISVIVAVTCLFAVLFVVLIIVVSYVLIRHKRANQTFPADNENNGNDNHGFHDTNGHTSRL